MSQIKILQPKEGVTIIPIKVPEGASSYAIMFTRLVFYFRFRESVMIELPFDCDVLGIATEIPESVWQGIVVKNETHNGVWYTYFHSMPGVIFNTSTESAMSFLEANEVYSKNPIPVPQFNGDYDKDWVYAYEKAEANTGTWVILMKQND